MMKAVPKISLKTIMIARVAVMIVPAVVMIAVKTFDALSVEAEVELVS